MKKNGFTLIELLAVIIILAIVALIATPIILNVIEDSRKSANKSQIELLLGGLEQLYASNMLSENLELSEKINNEEDVYDLIPTTNEKPANGFGKINNEGKVAIAVEIDRVCYSKNFDDSELKIYELLDGDNCILPPGVGEYLYQCRYYQFWKDEANPESDFLFDKLTGKILSYIGTDTEVIIPCEYDGVPVEVIGNHTNIGAFYGKNVTSVIIPDSIYKIENSAFRESKLISIIIPNSVTTIEHSAFYGIESLINIDLGDGVEFLGNSSLEKTSVVELTLPASLKTLEAQGWMDDLKILIIEEGKLTYLPRDSFWISPKTTYYEKVVIPSNITSIHEAAFKEISDGWGLKSEVIVFTNSDKLRNVEGDLGTDWYYDVKKFEFEP